VALFVLALVAAGGYAAAHYFLDRSWFVGVSDSGFVTVYKGIPEEIAGLDLKDEEQTTSIPEANVVPESLRERLRDGVKVDSLAAAQTMLANIRDQIRQFAPPNKPVRRHKKKGR
jgi:protein phosphatase